MEYTLEFEVDIDIFTVSKKTGKGRMYGPKLVIWPSGPGRGIIQFKLSDVTCWCGFRERMRRGRSPVLLGFAVAILIGFVVYSRLWAIDYRLSSDETLLLRQQFDLASRDAMDESAEWRYKYDQEVEKSAKCMKELIQMKGSFEKKSNVDTSNKIEMLQKENIGLLERVETLKQELEGEKLKCTMHQN